jgi:acetoacetyl-CoA synthetase
MSKTPIRRPSDAQVRAAQVTRFTDWLQRTRSLAFPDYESLWQWSVEDLDAFWASIWEYFEIRSATPYERVLGRRAMPGADWFPGATLNYVGQVFRHSTDARPAILSGNESGGRSELGWRELEAQVASLAACLRSLGVGPGDRVVAYMPNVPETIVAFLASASIGAIWSVCSPDMGRGSVLDRFRQIEPQVLIACDGTAYAGKRHPRAAVVAEIVRSLPTLRQVVWVPLLDPAARPSVDVETVAWRDAVSSTTAGLEPVAVAFDHPLWVVYSSGTTGMPKPIVHGHGGIVLESLKLAVLQNDLQPEDRFFWYSSTGWIMWNLQVAGLLAGATVCTFDGSPGGAGSEPDLNTLWQFAADCRATFFGAGAAYYASCLKAGLAPARSTGLTTLRGIGSTGSPLAPDSERWLYDAFDSVWVTAISGGTDVASAFVGGNPILPSYLGEMQCRCLGAHIEAWNDEGRPVIDEVGELVCIAPMPSMPLYFWNDPGNERYTASYFDVFPGVWRHGDWIRITNHAGARGAIIYGRSDATINRHGIRMGTAELYRAVEALPEVLDSMVVDLEYRGRESYMPLFVVLRSNVALDDDLRSRINAAVRTELSARHVPNEIIQVNEIPRTLTGKKLELPIKRLLLGHALEKVVNRDAMANAACLNWYVDFATRLNRTSPRQAPDPS